MIRNIGDSIGDISLSFIFQDFAWLLQGSIFTGVLMRRWALYQYFLHAVATHRQRATEALQGDVPVMTNAVCKKLPINA